MDILLQTCLYKNHYILKIGSCYKFAGHANQFKLCHVKLVDIRKLSVECEYVEPKHGPMKYPWELRH